MDKGKAIGLLKQALSEITHLRTLRLGNQEFELWYKKVSDIIEAAFGQSSSEYERFVRAVRVLLPTYTKAQEQKEYNRHLDKYETALKSIIKKYEILGIEGERDKGGEVKKMDKKEAIEFLKGSLREIPALAKLNYDNSEYPLWRETITGILKAVFGQNSIEYKEFKRSGRLAHIHTAFDTFTNIHQKDYITNLKSLETAILSIIKKYEISGIEAEPSAVAKPKDTAESPTQIFDKMQFHPKVIEASRKLFKDGHYRDAILRAFIEVNNFVKEKTGLELDGKALMAQVFKKESPVIKLNELRNKTEKDEQEGFMFLFMGAMVGIRNPKAHDNIIQADPYRTLEYLAFASLLMKRVEEGKLVTFRKNA